jgi:hypothetical protein
MIHGDSQGDCYAGYLFFVSADQGGNVVVKKKED